MANGIVRNLSFFAFAAVVALPQFAGAAYQPDSPNGECKRDWARRGFSADGPTFKNTLFSVSGKESYPDFYQRLQRDNCYKEWLIIVYMAANNDLSPYSFRDLWEMEAVGSDVSVDVIVFHDSALNDGHRYYHIAKAKNKIDYRARLQAFIKNKNLSDLPPAKQEEEFLNEEGPSLVRSPVIEKTAGDSGDIKSAGKFLNFALSRYPSRRVMLIGWSHGEGFDAPMSEAAGSGISANSGKQGGFAFNFATGSHMNVVEMAQGVRKLSAKYRRDTAFDIVGSDACLNQQVEFGYEWLGVADYVFGSSTIVQKKGFNYRTFLNWFNEHPLQPTPTLAERIPALYGGSVGAGSGREYSSYFDPKATMGVWTTAELILVKRALDDLGMVLAQWLKEPVKPLERIRRQTELQQLIGKSLRLGGVSNDLQYFLLTLENWGREKAEKEPAFSEALVSAVIDTMNSLNRAVLAKYIGKGYVEGLMMTSKGVAIWLPNSEQEFSEMFPKFKKSVFYQTSGSDLQGWADFIQNLY